MKGIAIFTLAFIVAACAATSARATGPITIAWVSTKNRHVSVGWVGPYLSYGTVSIATSPHTDSNGNLLHPVRSANFDAGDDNWTFLDPIKPGTYWVRVEGRDDRCQSHDDGNGTLTWTGCDTFSNIVKFTVKPICKKKLVRHGYYTYRNGRRIWHKPVYRTVCS